MGKHAKLSPSASHRWLVCPGSVAANANKPHTDNPYALAGTSAHGLLEVCLRLGVVPATLVGTKLDPGHMEITQEMASAVQYAVDFVAWYMGEWPSAVLHIEHPVDYGKSIGADGDGFGTSDVIIDNYPLEAVAIDYKHGTGYVAPVAENTQLLLYMLGQRQQRGKYQRYRAIIVQPRLPRRRPVQEAPTLTDAQLMGWVKKSVIPIVPVALGDDAPRQAGKHCRYCHVEKTCDTNWINRQIAASKEFKAK